MFNNRISILFILIALLVVLTGCVNKQNNNINTSNKKNELTEKEKDDLKEQYINAIQANDLEKVKVLIEKGVDINAAIDTRAALVEAIKTKNIDLVKYLIDNGANVNIPDSYGTTPLMESVYVNRQDIADLLISHYAMINMKDRLGNSALAIAFSINGANSSWTNYLLSKGADNKEYASLLGKSSSTTPSNSSKTSTDNLPDLQVLEYHQDGDYIAGTVINNTSKTYSYVEVDINLYDANGNQVGSTLSNVNNLESKKQWKFKAPVLNDNTRKFKVVSVHGN